MSKFRDMLEADIRKQALERGDDFIHSRNGDPHYTGFERGYLVCLKDVLTLCQEIERKINDS